MNAESQVVIAGTRAEKRSEFPGRVMSTPENPMQMIALAVAQGADVEKLGKLLDLQQRWEREEARKAFVEAMAEFKSEPANIFKTKDVNIPGGAKFKHATLADVVDGVVANLSKHGLSHRWLTESEGDIIKVTCVLTHKLGHSESCSLPGAPDDSGKKNRIQQVGSTVTYLQRYTLMAVCGLAAKDMDSDGVAPKKPAEPEPEGFANWWLDMEALADEGSARLTEVWGKAPANFRRYVVKFEEDKWLVLKNKAGKVQVPA